MSDKAEKDAQERSLFLQKTSSPSIDMSAEIS
jgi:hypothetical protein